MEDQSHHGLHEHLEAIQIQTDGHPLGSDEHDNIEIATNNASVSEEEIKRKIRGHSRIYTVLKCSKCNKKFRNPSLLQRHVKLHRGSTLYRCGHCRENFRELNKFLEHRLIHPPSRKRRRPLETNGFQLVHKAADNHQGVTDAVSAEAAQGMGLPSTSSIMNALCSALSSQADGNQPTSTVSAKPGGSEGIQIELPTQVKAIYFNHQSPNFSELMNFMMMVNNKMDAIIKHFNVPTNAQSTGIEIQTLKPPPEEQHQQHQPETTTTPTPTSSQQTPPVVHTPTTKEQQQQEYYASTLISSTPSKPWLNVLSSPFTLNIPHIAEQAVIQPGVLQTPLSGAATMSYVISDSIIDKVSLESRSRGNFAKNLTFQVFSTEERRGRNCTGRVFGRALPKGPLDSGKLNAVKEATFRKYPCHPSLIDITWKKECITAIDSGLRNETRTRVKSLEGQVNVHFNGDPKVE